MEVGQGVLFQTNSFINSSTGFDMELYLISVSVCMHRIHHCNLPNRLLNIRRPQRSPNGIAKRKRN